MQIRRHAAAIALCELAPIPFVDTYAQNLVRRRLVRHIASERQLPLHEDHVRALADEEFAPFQRAALWPLKAIAKKVFFFVTPVVMVIEYRKALAFGAEI